MIRHVHSMIGPSRSRFRLYSFAALCAALLAQAHGAIAAQTTGSEPDVVACYDVTRKIVTHTLPHLCQGEVVSAEREAQLAAERALRIQSTVQDRTRPSDPVTGTSRLIGTGSGFYVGGNGEIVTNDHVINRCALLTATSDDDAKHVATLVATSPQHDIALLRTNQRPPAVARFSAAPQRSDGGQLAVVGYPAYGLPTRLSSMSPAQIDPIMLVTPGDRVQFHGEVRHGNSGSPLLDESGNVVGVVHATIDTPKVYKATGRRVTDIGVAISYATVLEFLKANAVKPSFPEGPQMALLPDELHEKSRGFVVQIGCWK